MKFEDEGESVSSNVDGDSCYFLGRLTSVGERLVFRVSVVMRVMGYFRDELSLYSCADRSSAESLVVSKIGAPFSFNAWVINFRALFDWLPQTRRIFCSNQVVWLPLA